MMQNPDCSVEDQVASTSNITDPSSLNDRRSIEGLNSSSFSKLNNPSKHQRDISCRDELNSNNQPISINNFSTANKVSTSMDPSVAESDWKSSLLMTQYGQSTNNQHFAQGLQSIEEDIIASELTAKKQVFRRNSLPANCHGLKRKLSSDSETPFLPGIMDELSNSSCDPLVSENNEGIKMESPAWASCYSPYRKRTTSVISSEKGIDSLINKLFSDDQRQRFLALKKKKKEKVDGKEKFKYKDSEGSFTPFSDTMGNFSLPNLKESQNTPESHDNLGKSVITQNIEFKTLDTLKKGELGNSQPIDPIAKSLTENPLHLINELSSNSQPLASETSNQPCLTQWSKFTVETNQNIQHPANISVLDIVERNIPTIVSPIEPNLSLVGEISSNSERASQRTDIPQSFVPLRSNSLFNTKELESISTKPDESDNDFNLVCETKSNKSIDIHDDSKTFVNNSFNQPPAALNSLPNSSTFSISQDTLLLRNQSLSRENQDKDMLLNVNTAFETKEPVNHPTSDPSNFNVLPTKGTDCQESEVTLAFTEQFQTEAAGCQESEVIQTLTKPLQTEETDDPESQVTLTFTEPFQTEKTDYQKSDPTSHLTKPFETAEDTGSQECKVANFETGNSSIPESLNQARNEIEFNLGSEVSYQTTQTVDDSKVSTMNHPVVPCTDNLETLPTQMSTFVMDCNTEYMLKEYQSTEIPADFEKNQPSSIQTTGNSNQNHAQIVEDSVENVVGDSEHLTHSQDQEPTIEVENEVMDIDPQAEHLAENEQLMQMPVIYLENEGDLIFVDENGVILDNELVNSLLNISVDQLKSQIIQSASGNEGEVISIQTDSVQENVSTNETVPCISSCETECSDNLQTVTDSVNNIKDINPLLVEANENIMSFSVPDISVGGKNGEKLSLDALVQSLVGNQDVNYSENINFQQDLCHDVQFLPHDSSEETLKALTNNSETTNKLNSTVLITNYSVKENILENNAEYPITDTRDQLSMPSLVDSSVTSNILTGINSEHLQSFDNDIAMPILDREIESVSQIEKSLAKTSVSNQKSTARKSLPLNQQILGESKTSGYISAGSCDKHDHADSLLSLDDRPEKRQKVGLLSDEENLTADDPVSSGVTKTKCTALKTFVKPFTVAKKSVTDKTAFKSVIQSYFGVRTAKKTCKANQGTQNTADSTVIISYQDIGEIDSPEENSTESWSPFQELQIKASCRCSTEEVPCLCYGQELQLICEAEDTIDGHAIPCSKSVSHQYLLTPSSEIQNRAFCDVHMHRLRKHHCCPKCGIFCTQGTFLHCSYIPPLRGGKESHFFHPNCFLIPDVGLPPSCPHCCKFSDFSHVQLSLVENIAPDNSQTFSQMEGENLTSYLENYAVFMKNSDKGKENLPNCDAKVVPRNQELKAMIMAVTKDKAGLRPTGKCLFNPIKTGDVKKVLQLIGNGVDPNFKFDFHKNNTPLHIAAFYGLTGIVHVLLQYGAHIDAVNNDLETPLFLAVEKNQMPVTRYLIFAGAGTNIKNETGLTAFHVAAKNNAKEIARLLYDTGSFDINVQDDGGWTPLVWACENNHVDLVRWLLELGADPNVRDNEENTALHWAACSGDSEALELLLHTECNISIVNERGDSALHIAARKDNFVGVRLLLARDASTDFVNKDGETPLMCCEVGSKSLRILKRHMKKIASAGKGTLQQNVVHRDISRGAEAYPIQAINEVDQQEFTMEFRYITRNCYAPNISVVTTVDSMKVCYCEDNCHSHNCACTKISRCWYDMDGRLVSDFDLNDPPSIFECNKTCHCPKTCINRVVQKGLRHPLQLFRTHNRGWGLRTLKSLLKGTFVCEYIGEIVTEREIAMREDDSYLFDLESKDGEYCLDGKLYGNAARYINHSCDPNLVSIRAFIEHQDQNFPRIAFFTMKDIQAFEELCFDYGTDFWIAKCQTILCTCNSSLCKYSKDSIDETLLAYAKEKMTQNQTQCLS